MSMFIARENWLLAASGEVRMLKIRSERNELKIPYIDEKQGIPRDCD
jgi:hypothetical protein